MSSLRYLRITGSFALARMLGSARISSKSDFARRAAGRSTAGTYKSSWACACMAYETMRHSYADSYQPRAARNRGSDWGSSSLEVRTSVLRMACQLSSEMVLPPGTLMALRTSSLRASAG